MAFYHHSRKETKMSSSIGSVGTSFTAAAFKPPSDDDILAKIEKDFGKEAVASVTDEDGKLDKTKLEDFLKSKGIQPRQGKPPGDAGSAGQAAPEGSGASSGSGSPTEVKSQTRQNNGDGSVTTTITYTDGSVKKTTSLPDPGKVSDIYLLQHPEKDKKADDKVEAGAYVSVKI
jgi:hypothetical protein